MKQYQICMYTEPELTKKKRVLQKNSIARSERDKGARVKVICQKIEINGQTWVGDQKKECKLSEKSKRGREGKIKNSLGMDTETVVI